MALVKLSEYPTHRGIKTEIDGVEVPDVRDIRLDCPVDDVPTLRLTVNASPSVELRAKVDLVVENLEWKEALERIARGGLFVDDAIRIARNAL